MSTDLSTDARRHGRPLDYRTADARPAGRHLAGMALHAAILALGVTCLLFAYTCGVEGRLAATTDTFCGIVFTAVGGVWVTSGTIGIVRRRREP